MNEVTEAGACDASSSSADLLEQYGFLLLLVLISVGFTGMIISPVINFVFYLLLLGVR